MPQDLLEMDRPDDVYIRIVVSVQRNGHQTLVTIRDMANQSPTGEAISDWGDVVAIHLEDLADDLRKGLREKPWPVGA